MKTKVRFAPSPTGNVHIGNIRTAIFNYLFARHTEGEFILRVEDTDKERSTQGAIDRLLECMEWLGLDCDGEFYYQSQHEDEHVETALKLLDEKKAYYMPVKEGEKSPLLFRIPWNDSKNIRSVGNVEIEVHSETEVKINHTGVKFSTISKKGKPIENFASLAGFRELKVYDVENNIVFDVEENIDDILSCKKSFCFNNCSKISFLRREVFYNDLIKGELAKPLDGMKDLVIVRGNGSPVFHLANVYDDIQQGVTHIIRGDDHVENTYRHILLFTALGVNTPYYAHMPMIVNRTGKPYSKRDGDAFVGDFKEKGYLAKALFNYLSLLGWSPGGDREKMSIGEMIESFTLDRVKSSPAQFDMNKLLNLNGLYMAEIDKNIFVENAYKEALKQGWCDDIQPPEFNKIAEFMQSRTKIYSQVADWKYFFFDDSSFFNTVETGETELTDKKYEYDLKAAKKSFKKEEIVKALSLLRSKLSDMPQSISEREFEKTIALSQQEAELPEGKLNQPVRIAVTGKSGGADLFKTLTLIGRDKIIYRIGKVLDVVEGTLKND
ncbi:MAG TPA: glutamate--tRNA ligase family protein [Victivallales bacterium]|nr:glutamate--tRNA ligase family protein [Victivallales bacterium]